MYSRKDYKKRNSTSSFYPAEFLNLINPVVTNPIYIEMTKKLHHMDQTIYEHSIKVAYQVYKMSKFLNLDARNCVISALLYLHLEFFLFVIRQIPVFTIKLDKITIFTCKRFYLYIVP